MLGVVNLDKPIGPTSHDMVGLVRRLTGMRRIGHAGTLDPLASGVLPILVGAATRFSEELSGGTKRYSAVIRLGQRSVTDDAEGPITSDSGPLPDEDRLAAALRTFVGAFEQVPPAFSARKRDGMTAYRAARAGRPIELAPRLVQVDRIDLLATVRGEGWLDAEIDLRCGAGTYVRSIARDLGERLDCGGHLHALRRTEAAGLRVATALTPARLEELADADRLAEAVLPIEGLLPLPRLALGPDEVRRFLHGAAQPLSGGMRKGRHVIYDGGQLLGIGTLEAGVLRPDKVLSR
ncbi:MAG: tRNA pseudouridine(55) synthase TruB [Chloroflexota bacterium]|nr:tRNA pseudouridine(55) synthase TruB [Chloroflexota bacterium]